MEESWNCNNENLLRRVCAAGVIMCGIPLATAIVGDQARTHDGVIHAGG